MAKPPTCRICGAAHWSGETHKWPKAPAVDLLDQLDELPAELEAAGQAETGEVGPQRPTGEDYRARRAAYMRDYRARKAAGA